MKLNLGPVDPGMDGEPALNDTNMLGWNPRCIRRDISGWIARKWLTAENLRNATLGPASVDILAFQNELQGRFDDGFAGMHAAGHYVMGGDETDLWTSPADPMFWLHHAMVDQLWLVWQGLHPDRAVSIMGAITILDNPPSRNATLDDLVDIGINAPSRALRDLMNTLEGSPLCYIYL